MTVVESFRKLDAGTQITLEVIRASRIYRLLLGRKGENKRNTQ